MVEGNLPAMQETQVPSLGQKIPTPVFLPGESHGRGAWWVTVHGVAESDTTEWLTLPCSLCCRPVAQSCSTLCNPMDCSMPGFSVLHHLPEFAETHIRRIGDAIPPSHPLSSFPQSFPASGSLPTSRLFALGGQSIGASASV